MVKKTKKTVKKKSVKKKTPVKTKVITRTTSQVQVEKTLINNFIALQKVMTNLALKFDDLSGQLSKLLDLFQISAKALAEKNFNVMGEKEHEDILKRLDNMSEQNKILARGLTLLHEPRVPIPVQKPAMPRPQKIQMRPKIPSKTKELKKLPQPRPGEYQQSISTKPAEFKKL